MSHPAVGQRVVIRSHKDRSLIFASTIKRVDTDSKTVYFNDPVPEWVEPDDWFEFDDHQTAN